ncbi:MAG: multi-sensor hybrid histidine kinase, partial [Burkholderiales bacterium]|nr:multi-sensor hybrid histidine kinase [Burkholderiales bacterium]
MAGARSARKQSRKPARTPAASAPPLLGLTSDWYWEQDAELRFTRVEVRNDAAGEQALARQLLGRQRWQTGIEVEGGWEAHRALLEAREPFRDVLMWRNLPDGARRYISVSGEPMFDAKGRFSGYRGIGRDVSKQKGIQQLLKLDHLVTLRLAEAARSPEAVSGALRAICDSLRWACAILWRPDGEVLRRVAHWATPEDAGARTFTEATHDLGLRPGDGLVGTVWQTGEPVWIPDITGNRRASELRRKLAEQTGLRAAAIFPIREGNRVSAVLEFGARRIRQPDKRLWQTLGAIGTQIGQFLSRAEAERAVRESEARWRAMTNLSSDWYWELDSEYRFTRLEGSNVAGG